MTSFEKSSPDLLEILAKRQLVFGPFPPPEKGQTLVQKDLCLKKDFEKGALRTKCWPMPEPDQLEIEAQALEMVKAGLAEENTGKELPRFCSPCMLVVKEKNKDVKTSKAKRLCIDYRNLNARPVAHVGSLPNLEDAIKTPSQFQRKCKLDMRSGFGRWRYPKEQDKLVPSSPPPGESSGPS